MDPRVEEHAEVLVDYGADVEQGDRVVVSAPPAAADLEAAIWGTLGERGATPASRGGTGRAFRRYLQAVDPDVIEPPAPTLAMLEETDAYLQVKAGQNVAELSDVPPAKLQAHSKLTEPVLDYLQSDGIRYLLTQHPVPSRAQKAEMSTEAYADFVYDAVLRDWAAQRAFQEPMVDILDAGDTVRIVAGDETDLTMSIAGNPGCNDHGELNIPAGEAYTAPVRESLEGTVAFDLPVVRQGREIRGARLEFAGGEVVDHAAETNEDLLATLLETDEGARYVGELGIGMNRDIDRFTYNMLFDEKMGDTLHLALGNAYEETVGDGNVANDSAIHLDMLVDVSEDARIEIDGEVVQRDGRFVFEDDF